MANADRLMGTGMPANQAKEVAAQIDSGGGSVSWADVTGKPSTFPPTIGTTASTALAGNTAIPAPSSTTPSAPGTAAVGSSATYARADHVHPLQTTITGNAATATALATGRTFSLTGGATGTSAAFTGAANATIAVTLATPTSSVRGGVVQQAHPGSAPDPLTPDFVDTIVAALVAAGVFAAP